MILGGAELGKTCNNLGTPSVTGCFLAEMRETWAKTNFVVAFALAMGAWLWFLGWLIMRLLHAIGVIKERKPVISRRSRWWAPTLIDDQAVGFGGVMT